MAFTKTQTPLQIKASPHQESLASASSDSGVRGLLTSIESLPAGRAILLICLLSFLAYANSLGGQFVFDDTDQIVANGDIRSWSNLTKGFTKHVWAFREQERSLQPPPPLPYYRPIFTAMLTIEYHIFGLWPQGWHLVNILLHILSSVGVFYVLLLISHRMLVALFAGALFAVHPVHAESVCWISGMTDPLFAVFFLSSFYLYLKSHREGLETKKGTRSPGSVSRVFVLSLVLFLLACFSKETALSLVLLVFGYELVETPGKLISRASQAARRALPYAAIALLYLIPRYLVLGELMWKNPQAPDRPVALALLTLPFVVCSYVLHLAWPMNLSIAYDTHFVTTAGSPMFVLPTIILSLGIIALIAFRERISREVWISLLIIFVPLLPVLKLGQVSRDEYLVFDHYLYLSVAGFAYLLAIGLARLGSFEHLGKLAAKSQIGRAKLTVVAMVILLLMSVVGAARENRSWADSYELWSNAARIRPSYWAAHYNAGLALIDGGRYAEAHDWLDRAAKLKPDEAVVFDALGRASENAGDNAEAEKHFKRALELNPRLLESLNNLGTLYFTRQDYALAEESFVAALKLGPDAAAVRFNLGMCRARQGRYADAASEFERVARAGSDAEAYYELALAYEKIGRLDDARRALNDGRRLATDETLAGRIDEQLNRMRIETGTR
ncbi:MAG TPA: tetratricopeptide repeat protein [Blastocatellia bacterium]|nr:tetratricopeptide repeat protein [Blastocatellia bacterium]